MRRNAARGTFNHVIADSQTRRVGCNGKRCYETWQVAARMAKRVRRQHEEHIEPYKCRHCGAFHLGGKDGATAKDRKGRPRQETDDAHD